MDYIDKIITLKAKVMTADQVTAIELGFEYRNQSLEQFLIRFFERSGGKSLQKHMLLAEFVISLEKYNKLELILMFQELLTQYDSELMHAVILAKAHVENYLGTRHDVVEKGLDKPKPSSLFTSCLAEQVAEVYYSALFAQAQTSLIRSLRHKGYFGIGADSFFKALGGRAQISVVDLLPVMARVLAKVLRKYFPGSQLLAERGSHLDIAYDQDLLDEAAELESQAEEFYRSHDQGDAHRCYRSQPEIREWDQTQQSRFRVGTSTVHLKSSVSPYRSAGDREATQPIISNFYDQSSELVQDPVTGAFKMQPVFKSPQSTKSFHSEFKPNNCKSYCLYERVLDEVRAVMYQADKTYLQVQTQLKREHDEKMKNLATRVLGVVVQMPHTKVQAK